MKTIKILVSVFAALFFIIPSTIYAQNPGDTYVVANLNYFGFPDFAEEMANLGYEEGVNLTTLYYTYDETLPYAEMTPEELQALYEQQIQAMVDAGADVFVTNTDTDAVNLQPLVGNIPIVFARSDDPVLTGAVEDLIRPGRTMTGTITNRPHERRVELLKEILPETDAIYYLYNPMLGNTDATLAQVRAVAASLGIEVYAAPILDLPSGQEALGNTPEDVDWLFLTPNILIWEPGWNQAVIDTAAEKGIGTAYILGDPTQGWTMGYGPIFGATDRQAAQIVDRILRGASPAEIPVMTAENYLFVNLEAAEVIGLEFPLGIMRQADVIVRPGYFDALLPPDAPAE